MRRIIIREVQPSAIEVPGQKRVAGWQIAPETFEGEDALTDAQVTAVLLSLVAAAVPQMLSELVSRRKVEQIGELLAQTEVEAVH